MESNLSMVGKLICYINGNPLIVQLPYGIRIVLETYLMVQAIPPQYIMVMVV
ncbi:hypothetical protein IX327_000845 [Porphyromonas levii]|nr:hypothetical protein [Porphyromonas levii]